MTPAELDAIEARSLLARTLVQRHTLITDEFMQTVEAVVHSDTPALVAEVRRLQAEDARLRSILRM